MTARTWIVIVLGMLMASTANAAIEGVVKLSDSVFANTPFGDSQGPELVPSDMSDTRSSWMPPHIMPAFQLALSCKRSRCHQYQLRATAFTPIEARRQAGSDEVAASNAVTSRSRAMRLLDLALMLVISIGLLAYQLDRKQRVLRQSSLFSVSV
jgi:hypothetical protein